MFDKNNRCIYDFIERMCLYVCILMKSMFLEFLKYSQHLFYFRTDANAFIVYPNIFMLDSNYIFIFEKYKFFFLNSNEYSYIDNSKDNFNF